MLEPKRVRQKLARLMDGACVVMLLAIAWSLYRPMTASPFDIIDFSEFLPVLQQSKGILSSIDSLREYFATQGRTNIGTYSYIAVGWALFGLQSEGWQLAVWVTMAVLVVAVFLVGRGWKWSRSAAFLASAMLVSSSPAAEGWTRLTGEPLACSLFIGAVALAVRLRNSSTHKATVVAFTLLCAGLILVKEIFVCLVPVILAIMWVGAIGSEKGAASRRLTIVTVVVGLVVMLRIGWAAVVLSTAPEAAYGGLYRADHSFSARVLPIFLTILLPSRAELHPWALRLLIPANILFLLALGVSWFGCGVRLTRREVAGFGVFCSTVVLVGVLAYAPWPRFESFYALPFALGPLAMIGHGLSRVQRLRPRLAIIATLCAAGSVLLAGGGALRVAASTKARRNVEHAVVQSISRQTAAVTLVRAGRANQEWQGTGRTMRRYAAVFELRWPPGGTLDLTCNDARSPSLIQGQRVVVTYVNECGASERKEVVTFVSHFSYLDGFLQVQPDSIRIDVAQPVTP